MPHFRVIMVRLVFVINSILDCGQAGGVCYNDHAHAYPWSNKRYGPVRVWLACFLLSTPRLLAIKPEALAIIVATPMWNRCKINAMFPCEHGTPVLCHKVQSCL